jgi:hypothetical protein
LEHWKNFCFGLFFGMGFALAWAVLHFIASLISGATLPGKI